MPQGSIKSNSPEQTQKLGQHLADELKPGDVVCLMGELGTGKTQFVKGIAKGLGIEAEITSPTFVLLKQHEFQIPDSKPARPAGGFKILKFNHLDLYRVEGDLEAVGFGFDDLLGPDQITVIEWADRLTGILPADKIEVRFEYIDDTTRAITFPNKLAVLSS